MGLPRAQAELRLYRAAELRSLNQPLYGRSFGDKSHFIIEVKTCNRLFSSVDVVFCRRCRTLDSVPTRLGQVNLSLFVHQAFSVSHLVATPTYFSILSLASSTRHNCEGWNPRTKTSGFAGYVLRFSVRTEFLTHYEFTSSGVQPREYWIPTEDCRS